MKRLINLVSLLPSFSFAHAQFKVWFVVTADASILHGSNHITSAFCNWDSTKFLNCLSA